MAIESWVLDGIALTSGNFTLMELTADPPRARSEYINAADSEGAALIRQPLHENRVITLKLRVASQASMDAALDQVGAVVDKLREASASTLGVPLVWTPGNSTRTTTFDVIGGEVMGLPIAIDGDGISWTRLQRPIFTIELTCKPYWRGTEVTTSTASSSTPIVTLEVPSVPGDVPGLGRLIVTDTATQSRKDVEWGLENQEYDSGTALILDSDSFVTSGFAGTQTTSTGAYDPNASGNNVVRVAAVLSTPVAVCGTGNLSHVGVFRVWARVKFATEFQRVRMTWRDGDGPYNQNSWAGSSSQNPLQWSEVDLGLISINVTSSGTQRWDGRVEAYENPSTAAAVDIDYLLFIPAGEGYGRARSIYRYVPGATVGYDLFTGTTGGNALATRAAPQGGSWATSGATTDFVFFDAADGGELITRSTATDSPATGRFAILGTTNYTDIEVSMQVVPGYVAIAVGSVQHNLIARWTDSSNYMQLRLIRTPTYARIEICRIVAGSLVTVKYGGALSLAPGGFYMMRLVALANGRAIGQVLDAGGGLLSEIETYDTVFATGGTLATGKPGLNDTNTSTVAFSRYYDTFVASTPQPDYPVIYSGRLIEFRDSEVKRQDSAGTVYGEPPSYKGTRFLVPPGTSRVAVKARRVDLATGWVDNVTDATQIQVAYTPRGLVVPR